MTDATARMADAEAAQMAWDRFVGPSLRTIRADYLTKLAEHAAKPMEDKTLAAVQNLSIALRLTDQVEAHLKAIIADGSVARAEAHRASTIANMSPEARRFASY